MAEQDIRLVEAREAERVTSIDTRLTALIGLASVLSAALAASLPIALKGGFSDLPSWAFWLLASFVLYMASQAFACLLLAIQGLKPRDYAHLAPNALYPEKGATSASTWAPLADYRIKAVEINQRLTNSKVAALDAAYAALTNILGAAIGLILAASIVGATTSNASTPPMCPTAISAIPAPSVKRLATEHSVERLLVATTTPTIPASPAPNTPTPESPSATPTRTLGCIVRQ